MQLLIVINKVRVHIKSLIIIMLSLMILCGCEKDNLPNDTDTTKHKNVTINEPSGIVNVFNSEKISFEYDYIFERETHAHNIFTMNDRTYITAERLMYDDDDNYYSLMYLLSYDSDGGDMVSFRIMPTDDDAIVTHTWYDSECNLITIEELNYYYTLYKKTVDGDVIYSRDIDVTDVVSMVIGENDSIYIATKNEVVVYTNDGDFICEITLPNQFVSIMSTHGKKPILKMVNSKFKYINTDTKSLYDIELPLSDTVDYSEANILYGSGYDYYFYNRDGIFGYDIANNILTEVLDLINSDINTRMIKSFAIISPVKMAMVAKENIKSYLFILNRIPDDQVPQKEVIKLGWIDPFDDFYLNQLITSFNKNSDDYRILPINYYSDEYKYSSYEIFNKNIASGDEPDILYINYYIPILNYITKDMFVDLNPYLDSEPYLKADLLPFITENTMFNGKLPQLITGFISQTLVTKTTNVDGNLSITKLLDIYKSLPAGVSLLSNPNSDYLQSYFLKNLIPECVDYKNGTCDFTITAMREFLELLKMMPDSQEVIYDDIINFEKAQRDELYLVTAPIYGFKFYILYTKKPFMPNDTNVVGFPTADGGKRGDYIRSQGFSILNSSDKKDGAWEFIKYSLSEEFYKNEDHINLILAARSGIKYQITQSTNDRNYIYINTKLNQSYKSTNNNELDFEKIYGRPGILYNTEDLVNEYMQYLESIDNYAYYDASVASIIYDEVPIYLNSDKSVDDTIRAIQSRISLYMSEKWDWD